MERFVREVRATEPGAQERLMTITREELEAQCPWPTVRLQWLALMQDLAPGIVVQEAARQTRGAWAVLEGMAELTVAPTPVMLTCRADRIDRTDAHQALIYDYKTGTIPTKPQQRGFDKQLLLEAAMVERGAFAEVGSLPVAGAEFVGIKTGLPSVPAPLDEETPDEAWAGLVRLLARYGEQRQPYTARRALMRESDAGWYDHLSRFGEWDITDDPDPEDVG